MVAISGFQFENQQQLVSILRARKNKLCIGGNDRLCKRVGTPTHNRSAKHSHREMGSGCFAHKFRMHTNIIMLNETTRLDLQADLTLEGDSSIGDGVLDASPFQRASAGVIPGWTPAAGDV